MSSRGRRTRPSGWPVPQTGTPASASWPWPWGRNWRSAAYIHQMYRLGFGVPYFIRVGALPQGVNNDENGTLVRYLAKGLTNHVFVEALSHFGLALRA